MSLSKLTDMAAIVLVALVFVPWGTGASKPTTPVIPAPSAEAKAVVGPITTVLAGHRDQAGELAAFYHSAADTLRRDGAGAKVVKNTSRLRTFCEGAVGDKGCLSLFGDNPERHRLFAEHITAEYRIKTAGRGRTVDEWKLRPEASENHWLDCLVGCAVAASIQGVVLALEPVSLREVGLFSVLLLRAARRPLARQVFRSRVHWKALAYRSPAAQRAMA